MEIITNEVATYLKWLNSFSPSPINILAPKMSGGIVGNTYPHPINDGEWDEAMMVVKQQYSSDDLGAVWASVHHLSDGAVGKPKIPKSDVIAYRFLAIDLDNIPLNGERSSATDDELIAVKKVAEQIKADLVFKYRLPIPLTVCSGNGYLLLFPISLASTDANHDLLATLATAMATKYNAPQVDIDGDVIQDPSRVLGLVGTMNQNRPQIPSEGRVWRMRQVVGAYPNRMPMGADMFNKFATAFIAENTGAPVMETETTAVPSDPIKVDDGGQDVTSDRCRAALNRWAGAYLAKCAPAIQGQRGDAKTFQTAGAVAAGRCQHNVGLTEQDICRLMADHYNPKCCPPWDGADLALKVKSAVNNGTARAPKMVDCCDEISWGKYSTETADPIKVDDGDGKTGAPPKTADYPLTDVGNAEHFLSLYGADLLYVPLWKQWLRWDGRRWGKDLSNEISKMAVKFVRQDMLRFAASIRDDEGRQKYFRHLAACQQHWRIEAMLATAADMIGVDASIFDADGDLLNVENGTINLRTMAFKAHDRADMLTKMAPVKFDDGATCPLWEKFLNRIFQDENGAVRSEMIEYVRRAVGLSFTTEMQKALFILHGRADRGKSTLIDTVVAMMGTTDNGGYALVASQSLLLDNRHGKANGEDEASLQGARLAVCSEVNGGQRFDVAKLKRLTGSARITARRLYQNSFTFDATHKLWLDCNDLPKCAYDDAMQSRVKIVSFKVTIPSAERDGDLRQKLYAERDGILQWALRGLSDWRADGRLTEPKDVVDAVNAFGADSDIFGQFLADCIEPNDLAKTATDEVYRAYCRWAENNGIKYPITKIEFSKRMGARGYASKVYKTQRHFYGMALKDLDGASSPSETAEAARTF